MRLTPIILFCVLFAGCASGAKTAEPWRAMALQGVISTEEATEIAASAAQKHQLVTVGLSKAGDEIAVYLGKSRNAKSGLIVFYKKVDSRWVEIEDVFQQWSSIPKTRG